MKKGKQTEGEEIVINWIQEQFGYIQESEWEECQIMLENWKELQVIIDKALKAAEQRGRDYRQKVKHIGDTAEFGPFWEQFYLRVLDLPEVRAVLNIGEGTECAWNEIIRVRFGKAKLRSVDPSEIIAYFEKQAEWIKSTPGLEAERDAEIKLRHAAQECRDIIADLATPQAETTFKAPWECNQ